MSLAVISRKKITDTAKIPGSRADAYWHYEGFDQLYKKFRSGIKIPDRIRNVDNALQIQRSYQLNGFQFGNWVTNEDRYNYLSALYIALYDLDKVIGRNMDLGFKGRLSVSFGARGKGRAMAHYEPGTDVINMTRYKDGQSFVNSGGIGAFAHEYAHFLDFHIGRHYDQSRTIASLSGGLSTNPRELADNRKSPLRSVVEDILQTAYWDEPNKKESEFLRRIKTNSVNEYWRQRAEVFARLFEQYVSFKLKSKGIYNHFLSQEKYGPKFYMKPQELQRVTPMFDQFCKMVGRI